MQTRTFSSLGAFASFLVRAGAEQLIADEASRGATAHFLAEEVRDRIGDADRLPPPLADSTVVERIEAGYSGDETLLRTGALRDSIGWGHEGPRETIVGSTDEKAPFHEFGTTHTPKRSFLASTLLEKEDEAFEVYVKTFGVTFRPR